MTIKLIIYAVLFIAGMGALGALYANGYASGYSARDIEYVKATKALNSEIADLKGKLAAEEAKRVAENAIAVADVMQNLGGKDCKPLSKDDVSRLNRIK